MVAYTTYSARIEIGKLVKSRNLNTFMSSLLKKRWNINGALTSNLSRYHLISQSHCHKLNSVDPRPRYAIIKPP